MWFTSTQTADGMDGGGISANFSAYCVQGGPHAMPGRGILDGLPFSD